MSWNKWEVRWHIGALESKGLLLRFFSKFKLKQAVSTCNWDTCFSTKMAVSVNFFYLCRQASQFDVGTKCFEMSSVLILQILYLYKCDWAVSPNIVYSSQYQNWITPSQAASRNHSLSSSGISSGISTARTINTPTKETVLIPFLWRDFAAWRSLRLGNFAQYLG